MRSCMMRDAIIDCFGSLVKSPRAQRRIRIYLRRRRKFLLFPDSRKLRREFPVEFVWNFVGKRPCVASAGTRLRTAIKLQVLHRHPVRTSYFTRSQICGCLSFWGPSNRPLQANMRSLTTPGSCFSQNWGSSGHLEQKPWTYALDMYLLRKFFLCLMSYFMCFYFQVGKNGVLKYPLLHLLNIFSVSISKR